VWLSAPLITLFYILGTACVLAFSRPAEIDLISPAMQTFSRGAQAAGVGFFVGPFVAALISGQVIANSSVYCNAAIRLPMVAGWDHLLPAWLSRLHPRFKTPVGSVLCFGAATFAFTVLGNLGVGSQETFQLLNNSSIICWALTYLVMFAIPLAARGEKPRLAVRVAALSGFSMTLLYVVLAIFPVVEVPNPASFAAKVGGAVAAVNALGVWHFRRAKRRRVSDVSAG
jgi:amino acid transporter